MYFPTFSLRTYRFALGAAVLFASVIPFSAFAATSVYSASLFVNGDGTYSSWNGDHTLVDELGGTPDCSDADSVADDGGATGNGEKESYVSDISSIPNGATITGIDVKTYSRLAGATTTAGTYKSIIILNGLELAYPSSITPSTEECGLHTQSFTIGNYVKTSHTTLEMGVMKSNEGDVVRLGAININFTYSSTEKSAQTLSVTTHASESAIYRSTFSVAATSTSGLPVEYSLTGGCSISEAFLDHSVVTMMSGTVDCVVHYTQPGNDSYNAATEVTETITAQKRNLTVTATGVNKVYDTTAAAQVTLSTDKIETDAVVAHAANVEFSTPDVGTAVPVFATGISIDGADSGNYALVNTSASAVANITIASAIVSLAENQNLNPTYDGTSKPIAFTTNPSGLTLSVTYNGETTAPTNVGTYTVVATVTSSNYAGTNTQTLTITRISSGGGSGGGGSSFIPIVSVVSSTTSATSTLPVSVGEVLGAQTCAPLITSTLALNENNDSSQVKALQTFLNSVGAKLPVTGFFGALTDKAVRDFQLTYWQEVLAPWVPFGLATNHTATGRVAKTTAWKINTLNCVSNGFSASDIPFPVIP